MSKATITMPLARHTGGKEIKLSPTSGMVIGSGISMMIWGAIILAVFG